MELDQEKDWKESKVSTKSKSEKKRKKEKTWVPFKSSDGAKNDFVKSMSVFYWSFGSGVNCWGMSNAWTLF